MISNTTSLLDTKWKINVRETTDMPAAKIYKMAEPRRP
jgi:hypothetical protein